MEVTDVFLDGCHPGRSELKYSENQMYLLNSTVDPDLDVAEKLRAQTVERNSLKIIESMWHGSIVIEVILELRLLTG